MTPKQPDEGRIMATPGEKLDHLLKPIPVDGRLLSHAVNVQAVAHNALLAVDAADRGQGGWDRARRKMRELFDVLSDTRCEELRIAFVQALYREHPDMHPDRFSLEWHPYRVVPGGNEEITDVPDPRGPQP